MRNLKQHPFSTVFAALTLIGLGLLSCSDDVSSPEPDEQTSTTKTIPASGGSVQIENEDGVQFKVTLPEGAVLKGTRVVLRAIEAPAGVHARFALEPAGLRLFAPATFTVTLPSNMTVRESFGMSFQNGEQVFIPATVDVGARTLTATLYQLGFTNPGAVRQTAGAAVTADDAFIDVDEMSCQIVRDALTDQILRAQAFSGPFPPDLASPLIQEYRAALLVCESEDSVAGASAILREYACNNINSSVAQADAVPVTNADELRQSLGFLIAAEGMAQEFGADCHVQTSTMEAEFDEFLTAYIERINSPNFTRSFPTWDALWRENLACVSILALAQEYAVEDAADRVNNEVFPALFARLREVASAACAEDENNTFLLDILTGGHRLAHPVIAASELPSFSGLPEEELTNELLRCGGSVLVEAKASDNLLLGGTTVQLTDGSASVRVTDNGKLVLTSDIMGFTCTGGIVTRPPIRVRAEVPETLPVVQLGNLSGTLNVNLATTLAALPAPEEGELPQSFDIVIERDRNVCGIDAPGVLELCRIRVDATGFLGSMAGLWSGGCPGGPVSGTFVIQIASDGTVTGTYDGSASGSIEGTVNSNGTFDASANGTAGSCNWFGSLNLAGGVVSGSGSWSCSEAGCSGEYHSAPLP